mgnify:CR=1 FL=1
MNREDIDVRYTWDLSKIFSSNDKFNESYDTVSESISKFSSYKDDMLKDADSLYNTLEEYYNISRGIDKLYSYVNLLFDTDTSNNSNQELKGKVSNLYSKFISVSYFVGVNILKLDEEKINKFIKDNSNLEKYRKLLMDELRYKKYTLSDSEEQLLSKLSKTLGNNYDTYELFKDCDMEFGSIKDEEGNIVKVDNSNYSLYIESKDRRVRKEVFDVLYETYKRYKNTFASLIYNNINEEVSISKIRGYNSAIESSLYHDEVNLEVYDNLIDSVNEEVSILYKYYDMKKKILGLDELHLYDIYVSMVDDYNVSYKFDDAVKIVRDALSVLGNEYIKIYDKGIKDRWIDVYPTYSKRTGGYSSGSYDTYPYVLLNYQDKYGDMSTLAHEMGHSIHSYYTRSNNLYMYGDYSIFVAEVASTVNELLLSKYMIKNSNDKKEKLYILNKLMELFRATIYRQTMFAEFEKDIYNEVEKDNVLTAELLSNKYYELNKKYFGSNVVVDDEIRYEWERIPHFYYNFYVYKYATGLSCACKIVDNILSGKANAVENYISFLKCGRTKNPIESLLVAGVDVTKKEVVLSAIKMFSDTIDEFESIINEK